MDTSAHPLKNRTTFVTGGGRGLGRAMVLGLAQAGAQVVATSALEAHEVEETAREARTLCGEDRVLALTADVTHEEDCARTLEATLKRFGHLDILVINAGRGMKYVSPTFMTEPTRFGILLFQAFDLFDPEWKVHIFQPSRGASASP